MVILGKFKELFKKLFVKFVFLCVFGKLEVVVLVYLITISEFV